MGSYRQPSIPCVPHDNFDNQNYVICDRGAFNIFFLGMRKVWRDLQCCVRSQKVCEQVFGRVLLSCAFQKMEVRMSF